MHFAFGVSNPELTEADLNENEVQYLFQTSPPGLHTQKCNSRPKEVTGTKMYLHIVVPVLTAVEIHALQHWCANDNPSYLSRTPWPGPERPRNGDGMATLWGRGGLEGE